MQMNVKIAGCARPGVFFVLGVCENCNGNKISSIKTTSTCDVRMLKDF